MLNPHFPLPFIWNIDQKRATFTQPQAPNWLAKHIMINIKQTLWATALTLTTIFITSCNFSSEELHRMARKEIGKDDFRDSEKWGKVVTEALTLDAFTHIDLQGSADIKFTQGDVFKVEAQGNEKAIAYNDISVKDGTLTVKPTQGAPKQVPTIKLIITAPNLESINVSGSGDIDLKEKSEFPGNLSIHIGGTGDVDVERVKCKKLDISITGDGDITAKKIKCKKAHIAIAGEGDMKAELKANDIHVEISSSGDADFEVKCQNLTVTAGGTGEIELKGECAHFTKQAGGMADIDSRLLEIHEGLVIQ